MFNKLILCIIPVGKLTRVLWNNAVLMVSIWYFRTGKFDGYTKCEPDNKWNPFASGPLWKIDGLENE